MIIWRAFVVLECAGLAVMAGITGAAWAYSWDTGLVATLLTGLTVGVMFPVLREAWRGEL